MRPRHEVSETPAYLAAAARAGITDDDRAAVVDFVAANPQTGDLIKRVGRRPQGARRQNGAAARAAGGAC